MSPTSARGRAVNRVYRYYVSAPLQQGKPTGTIKGAIRRVPAAPFQAFIADGVRPYLKRGDRDDVGWDGLRDAVVRIEVHPQTVEIALRRDTLLSTKAKGLEPFASDPKLLRLSIQVRYRLRGGATSISNIGGAPAWGARRHDAALIKGLRSSHALIKKIGATPNSSLDQLRKASTPKSQYERRLSALAFLAPDIQAAILQGRQPAELTLSRLMALDLPLAWADQRAQLGFGAES